MTDTADRLAALLRDLDMIPDKTAADDHIPDMEWAESHSRVIAARLIAAGVTLATPAPLDVEVAALDEALRPYLELLRSPDDQNDKIIRGVAARLAATKAATPAPLDVERLARALGAHVTEATGVWGLRPHTCGSDCAAAIAAAYAEETP